jgi:hypothetical protein
MAYSTLSPVAKPFDRFEPNRKSSFRMAVSAHPQIIKYRLFDYGKKHKKGKKQAAARYPFDTTPGRSDCVELLDSAGD